MSVDVRFGSAELPTREGTFAVFCKSRDHVSSLYDTSMPFAMFFSGGQAVHYSPDFAANGYNGASHGCVNVRDYGARPVLFDQVPSAPRWSSTAPDRRSSRRSACPDSHPRAHRHPDPAGFRDRAVVAWPGGEDTLL